MWLREHVSTLASNAVALRGIRQGGQELCPQGHPLEGCRVPAAWDARRSRCPPVMLILADHLEVPSRTLCFTAFICCVCVVLVTPNTSWISSKISGLLRSRIFMRSLSTMMMFWVRSSAPCLELFSAAPGRGQQEVGLGGDSQCLGKSRDLPNLPTMNKFKPGGAYTLPGAALPCSPPPHACSRPAPKLLLARSVPPQGEKGRGHGRWLLTLQAVGVEQVLALLVALDAALGAAHALPGDAPEQPLALVAVGGGGGRPHLEVVGRRAGDGVH